MLKVEFEFQRSVSLYPVIIYDWVNVQALNFHNIIITILFFCDLGAVMKLPKVDFC